MAAVVRTATTADWPSLQALYPAAFPTEDLVGLVEALADPAFGVVSLVGTVDGALVAHLMLTPCAVDGAADPVCLVGPVAVMPAHQRQGLGTTLLKAGLARMETAGFVRALVLGDPAYYGRFGFETETGVVAPHPLPADWTPAWQGLALGATAVPVSGLLDVPAPWRPTALWGP